jgi:hypothetical protein
MLSISEIEVHDKELKAITGTARVFRLGFTLEDAIEFFHAFAPLEALPCVCPMAFLWGVHSSYRLAL